MRQWGTALAVAAAVLASGCTAATSPPADERAGPAALPPGAPGPLEVRAVDYNFGTATFYEEFTGAPFPMQIRGILHTPIGAPAPSPLVVFQHGYHGSCEWSFLPPAIPYFGNATTGPFGRCPDQDPVVEAVNSHRGYDYIAKVLASHGYAVASIDASELNDLVYPEYPARAALVLETLDRFRDANASVDHALGGSLDVSRIGLMGHSRGGAAVAIAAVENQKRPSDDAHQIRAVFGLAAANFAMSVPNVALGVLLPFCDGDARELNGALLYDGTRYVKETNPSPKIQMVTMGANHNYYNSVWTNNDGYWMDDPYCGRPASGGGGLLAPEDSRRHGLPLMAGFFRLFVGGENGLSPYFTGEASLPADACPGGTGPCPGLVHISYHPPAGDRIVIDDTLTDRSLQTNTLGQQSVFAGFESVQWCLPRDCPSQPNVAGASQLTLRWSSEASWILGLGPMDVSAFDMLTLRVAVNHEDPRNALDKPQDFTVVLRDSPGAETAVPVGSLTEATYFPPGDVFPHQEGGTGPFSVEDQNARVVLNEIRVPLASFDGIDVTRLDALEMRFDRTDAGSIQVTDVLFRRSSVVA